MSKPLCLVILDGWGIGDDNDPSNAIKASEMNFLNSLLANNPQSVLKCSGLDVGLPKGQMGNSEVGHMNIGAGRIVYQELTRISKSVEDGDFFDNDVLIDIMKASKDRNLHIFGLLSDGGVHSHIDHLLALVNMAKQHNLYKVYVHCFMDGRDTPPNSGLDFLEDLEQALSRIGVGEIATVSGRYYSMDRDKRYERTKLAYDAIVYGKGEHYNSSFECIEDSYQKEITDEFVIPSVIADYQGIQKDDCAIYFNFRPDRARQLTDALTNKGFGEFDVEDLNLKMASFTSYGDMFPNVNVAFKAESFDNTLGELLSKKGIKQARIAETEKYAHVTFFLNGGRETVFDGERRVMIPSPKVATYDLAPQMSANEVKEAVITELEKEESQVIIVNFANLDMVGHTGDINAVIKAAKTVDLALKDVVDKVLEKQGICIVTADHGNAEKMIDEKGNPLTSHTSNDVHFVIVGYDVDLRESGRLSDIAPTILDILQINKPVEMTGVSLIKE